MAYLVKAFATLAGVTVRTLHHYDRIGLLKPSDVSPAGHRLYTDRDLLRLQQILLLKWMGYSLQDIQQVLDDPAYDLHQSLSMQLQAVQTRINELTEAARLLEEAIKITENRGAEELSSELVVAIIKHVLVGDNWFMGFYSEQSTNRIMTRRLTYSQAEMEAGTQAWRELIADFEQVRHEEPGSPAVQALAARMYELITAFTAGDPQIVAEMRTMYEHYDEFPAQYRMADDDLAQLMGQAIELYMAGRK